MKTELEQELESALKRLLTNCPAPKFVKGTGAFMVSYEDSILEAKKAIAKSKGLT